MRMLGIVAPYAQGGEEDRTPETKAAAAAHKMSPPLAKNHLPTGKCCQQGMCDSKEPPPEIVKVVGK